MSDHSPEKTLQDKNSLNQLIETVHRLRAPGGCPWDRAQTHQSLRQYLIEEAYEVLDVIDQIATPEDLKRDQVRLPFREELGDLLMQVVLHSEMASETQAFDFYDVAKALNEKLIRRHPHVFKSSEDAPLETADLALQSWEKEKAKEKAAAKDGAQASTLDGVPRSLPALQKASRIIEKVTKVGFQWDDLEAPLAKVDEEWNELKEAIQKLETQVDPQAALKEVESEMGDLLFTLCNMSYLMKFNPEDALRGTLARFESRFRHVESKLKELGKIPEQSNLKEMDSFWNEAKRIERVQVWGLSGSAGAGKSTAAQIFAEFGIPTVDADLISRDLIEPRGAAYDAVMERFKTCDRKTLRAIVFKDANARKDLEAILHPLILIESQKRIRKLAVRHPVVLYEAALLVETERYRDLSGLIVIHSPYEICLSRLLTRPGMDLDMAKRILAAQLSEAERNACANLVIENDGTLDSLKTAIRNVIADRQWS